MTTRVDIPREAQVRAALDEILKQAADSGTRPSVLALARRFSMSNTTFRRHFPELALEVSAMRSAPAMEATPDRPSRYDELVARNAKLKRRNRELNDHLTVAAAHIQRITLENQRLRQGLESATGVTRLTPFPAGRSSLD
jgi:predicted nucleic acid-binding protein